MIQRILASLKRRGSRWSARVWLILGLNLLAALLATSFLTFFVTRPLGSPQESTLLILGEDALREEAARAGLPLGRPAPGFGHDARVLQGLTDLQGRPLDLTALLGQPVWIVFWATYCHACQEEEPDLRRAFAAHQDDGLVVLAIDAGEAPQDVRRYVEERRLPWRIGLDPRLSAYDAYGAIGTPTHYFIGRDGRIAARAFGRLEPDEMEAHLAQILAAAD